MDIFKQKVGVPSFIFIFVIMVILAFTSLIFFIIDDVQTKWSSIFAGLFTAFCVASIQIFISYYEHKKLNKYESMGVIDIVKHRRGKEYYGNILSKCEKEISLMGTTASRFLNDFGNHEIEGNDDLIQALKKGAKVRILLPKLIHMPEKSTNDYQHTTKKFTSKLEKAFPDDFKVKHYDHVPAHSILIVDKKCIVGPLFANVDSKNSPAITFSNRSDFVKPYIEYFNNSWQDAEDNEQ